MGVGALTRARGARRLLLPGCGGCRLAVWFTGIEHGGRAWLSSRRGSPLVGVELWGAGLVRLLSAVRLLPFWGLWLMCTKRRAAPLAAVCQLPGGGCVMARRFCCLALTSHRWGVQKDS